MTAPAAAPERERSRWFARDWTDHELWAPGSIHSPDVVPMDLYHHVETPGVSKSRLDLANASVHRMLHPPAPKEADYFDFGSAVNDAIVDPALFERRFVRGPEDRRGNKWKDAKKEAKETGRIVLISSEYDLAKRWGDAVHDHPIAGPMLGQAHHQEATLVWEDEETGLLCRCRPDVVTHALHVVDVKTAYTAARRPFRGAIFRCRYHVSAAMTIAGVKATMGHEPGYVYLVIDKDCDPAPEAVALYQLDDDFRIRGMAELRSNLERVAAYLRAEEEGRPTLWAGYPLGVETLTYFRGDA